MIYGIALTALFTISALYHRWPGDPRWKPWLQRLDHSTIFIFIAASYTPITLLVLHGTVQTVVLISVWAGAAAGVTLSLAWINAPRLLTAACYLALGWVAVVAFPQLLREAGVAPFVLLAVGGGLYSLGAGVYAAKRPNLWPRTFGFHEVFHALVIAAALGPVHRDRGLGRPERRELRTAGSEAGSTGASQSSRGIGTHSWSIRSGESSSVTEGRDAQDARKTASVQTMWFPAQT